MDYEKAYKEALERARSGMQIDEVFPELYESEDEKIRKGLIQHLKELRDWKVGTMSPIKVRKHYDAWIAYIAKQKEQKSTEGNNETEIQKAFREGKSAGRKEVFDHPEEYGLQEEQKSAEWNKEDELHLKNAILAAEKEWGADSRTAEWLKALQPNWKPSEEQMKALVDVITMKKGNEYETTMLRSLYNDLAKL